MNVQMVARILGPVLLKETDIGKKALRVINEVLPEDFRVPSDVSGEQALAKIEELPSEWQAVLEQSDVEDDRHLAKLKREIAAAKVKKAVVKRLPRSWVAIAASLVLAIMAMVIVLSYAVITAQTGEANTESLSTILKGIIDIINALLK